MELLADRQTRGYEPVPVAAGIDKRIFFLEPADRKFLQLALSGTLTRREIGLLLGQTNGTISRRVRGLLKRLNEPIVIALVDRGEFLPEGHREVGLAFFLRGLTLDQIAAEFDYSRYAVRKILEFVRGWHGGAGMRRKPRRRRRAVVSAQ